MQLNYTCVGDVGSIFCGKIVICVQQPWQSMSLWSVADRFLSTFSFILICGSSLSLSHAENEVSRLETALQPTCQISLFSPHIRFFFFFAKVDSLLPPGSEISAFWKHTLDIYHNSLSSLCHCSPPKKHSVTKGSLFFFCASVFSPPAMTTCVCLCAKDM